MGLGVGLGAGAGAGAELLTQNGPKIPDRFRTIPCLGTALATFIRPDQLVKSDCFVCRVHLGVCGDLTAMCSVWTYSHASCGTCDCPNY